MLCQFSFENFKSHKNLSTLDLCAEPLSEHIDSLIVDKDGEKFLPVSVIYGPNGGGKSNTLEAIYYFFSFILNLENISKKRVKYSIPDVPYHKFDLECKNKPTKFDVLFRTTSYEVSYQISILGKEVVEEYLYVKKINTNDAKTLIERNENETKLYDVLEDIPVSKVSRNIPLLSHIAFNYDVDIINEIINWFLNSRFVNFGNFIQERNINVPNTDEEIKKTISLLNQMGINIKEIRKVKDENNDEIKDVYIKKINKDGDLIELNFYEESSGTQKVFSFSMDILYSLSRGGILVVDELDAKLHPKLLEFIIQLFTNKETNKKGAQLILTSHDVSTMNSDVFRRDEIWFCALNPDNVSMLYSLYSFKREDGTKTRKDESYGKRYLEGRYGADPYLKKILEWDGNVKAD